MKLFKLKYFLTISISTFLVFGCKTKSFVKDIDGNVYTTTKIGTQEWTVENLKTTKFNDGSLIPLVTESTTWIQLYTPAYCWYNNDTTFKNPYGALYNWYTIKEGKLCPVGWHVPSAKEWATMINYLGGTIIAGGKLKEKGTKHWLDINSGATNKSGFNGLPGGYRYYGGNFNDRAFYCFLWSSSITKMGESWALRLDWGSTVADTSSLPRGNGHSVRCIKN